MNEQMYRANGKLLITGEYAVLDGALALAIPTKLGQRLRVSEFEDTQKIAWESYNAAGEKWLDTRFTQEDLENATQIADPVRQALSNVLNRAIQGKTTAPLFGKKFSTQLEFPNNWGLGSSSTLISLVAQYVGVDVFELSDATFGGSGYDVACATANGPIFYRKTPNGREIRSANFPMILKNHMYFVHLNQKQNSRSAIAQYKQLPKSTAFLEAVSAITSAVAETTQFAELADLLQRHEDLLSAQLQIPTIKAQLFSDYPGVIKSLGAWGGDFVLALSETPPQQYFIAKGFATCLAFDELFDI
ncbi:GYDIA family GHMP kinase [Flavobacterium sp.]|uniref:GYDIA family GHMP kinase n=1 Tax=Flavobacterium sp. TaxID=239 RepID=UPI003B9AEE57